MSLQLLSWPQLWTENQTVSLTCLLDGENSALTLTTIQGHSSPPLPALLLFPFPHCFSRLLNILLFGHQGDLFKNMDFTMLPCLKFLMILYFLHNKSFSCSEPVADTISCLHNRHFSHFFLGLAQASSSHATLKRWILMGLSQSQKVHSLASDLFGGVCVTHCLRVFVSLSEIWDVDERKMGTLRKVSLLIKQRHHGKK